jgi:hypothetical protein
LFLLVERVVVAMMSYLLQVKRAVNAVGSIS